MHPRHLNRFALLAVVTLVAAGAVSAQDADPRPGLAGGIYDKPYLDDQGPSISVGGYIDHEFEWVRDGGNTFDQHRFIPFITAEVSERVTVSAEIEFEHGGFVAGDGETDGEIKLEYAVLDFSLREGLNYRGGVILVPLGAFNLRHDSPINDLTARPVVDRQLIPSTFSESGMGFFGTLYPGESSVLDYEIYLVNGFDEGIFDDKDRLRVRGGRGSQKSDNNENKALAGRLGLSPRMGSEIGVSVHTGKYDADGERRLTIAAVDALQTFGALTVKGELATVSADVDRALRPDTAESQRGAYLEAGWHFGHDVVMPGSVFTLVGRGDMVDFDADRDGDDERGLTLGLNFRPTEETAFKLDYRWGWKTAPDATTADSPDNTLFFSFASYF